MAASLETLLDQASMTAEQYYDRAYSFLEERHGKKFVNDNPLLVIELAKIASEDFKTMINYNKGNSNE